MRKDWIESELQFIAKIEWGNTSITKKSYELNGYTAFSAAGPDGFLSQAEWFGEGVVLSAIGANCGKCFYADGEWAAIKNTIVIQTESVNTKYLFHYLNNKFKWKISGTGQPFITLKNARQNLVPLAPLPEQRAIVSKIEELFSDLDKGVTDLKKAQDQLKIYRQAVLKKAFEGETVTNSECKKLISITSKIGSGSTPKGGKKNYKPSGIPLIRSMNIHFDFIKYDELAFIDENQAEKLKNVIVNKGDVLLNITGASIGRVNIAPEEFDNGRVNQHVSIIRPLKDSFVPKYLKYFLQSPDIQHWISNANYGVTRQALTKGMLENLELPLPSSIEQHQIVQEIESRLSVCDKVEESISESLEKAKALRQSILKKAFEGRLLSTQEIEKCKAAPDYEPAAVLLEKIKNL